LGEIYPVGGAVEMTQFKSKSLFLQGLRAGPGLAQRQVSISPRRA
jgi:hypothetical protein